MNKSEAVAVLREIFATVGESVCVESVSLDDMDSLIVDNGRGYQIKMRCTLDSSSKASILTILERKQLEIKEENGYVLICKIHS